MQGLRGASKGKYLDFRLGANTRSCRGLDRRRQYGPSCRPAVGHSSVAGCARKRSAVDLLVASSINEIEPRAAPAAIDMLVKVQRKVSDGVAGLAAAGSSPDRQKRQFLPSQRFTNVRAKHSLLRSWH
jgi:hypothetical protein